VGLDVYVGPLTRYYSFEWETVVQQAGREQGLDVQVIRPPGFQEPDAQDVLQGVAAWRKTLGDTIGVPMRWDESAFGAYETDKPDWDGYQAVRFLALHEEFPELPSPTRIDRRHLEALDKEPLEGRFGEVYVGRNPSRIGRLLGRRPPEAIAPPRYLNIQTPELWLPITMDGPIHTTGPGGNALTIGSVEGLVTELERVNDKTVRMDQQDLIAARESGPPDDGAFDPLARFGLAVFLGLARTAHERVQPMILDY
jgi:hypothetical protein